MSWGGVCDWVRERRSGLQEQGETQAGSVEPAEGKERRRIRPINLAIVANWDRAGGRGGGALWSRADWREERGCF